MKKEVVFLISSIFAVLIISTTFVAASGKDLNGDSVVNRTDIVLLASVYRSSNATFDQNNDSVINLFDLVIVSKNVSNAIVGGSNLTLTWFSDWSTATGNGTSAVRDGSKFNAELGPYWNTINRLTVVADPTGLFPTTNVLRAGFENNGTTIDGGHMVSVRQGWTSPAVGQYIFSRIYIYYDQDVGENPRGHWFHHGANIGAPYGPWWDSESTSVNGDMTFDQAVSVAPNGRFDWSGFKSKQLYRMELRIYRITSDNISIEARVYNGTNGTLVANSSNFVCVSGPCGYLTESVDDNPRIIASPSSYTWTTLELGNNGGDPQPLTKEYRYFGAAAIRVSNNSSDWIGTYPVTGVED